MTRQSFRPPKDRAEEAERALSAYRAAAAACDRKAAPNEWARLQHNVGVAYRNRIYGDRAENLELAIAAFQVVLEVRTRAAAPEKWIGTMNGLGTAYAERVRGDRAENLSLAIKAFTAALEACSRATQPVEWTDSQNNLGNAYAEQVAGDRAENLELAILAYRSTLEVRTRADYPVDWANTQTNLANVYRMRIRGDRAQNLENAMASYKAALQVRTRRALPVEWAVTQNNLGIAYAERIRGDRADNLELAIAAHKAALRVRTRANLAIGWATTTDHLASAYIERILGDRAKNIEMAIAMYKRALEVRTRSAFPVDWAMTRHNLGFAYQVRVRGDPAKNLELAITSHKAALEVFAQDTRPSDTRTVAKTLGDACSRAALWSDAAKAYQTAWSATEVLYAASLLPSSKENELAEAIGIAQRGAYALSKLSADDARAAAVFLERGRARGLGDALARDRTDLANIALTNPRVYENYRLAAEQIHNLEAAERRHDAETESLNVGDDGSWDQTQRVAQREAAEDALRQAARKARVALAKAVDRIQQITQFESFLTQPDLDEILAAAEVGTPIAYLVTAPAGSLILLVHRRGNAGDVPVEAIFADSFTEQDLNALLVKREGNQVTGGYLPGQLYLDHSGVWLEAALSEVLPVLGNQLIGRLAARLVELDATSVILIPTGRLALLPLHAARYSHGQVEQCLLDQFDVSYAPSAKVVTAARASLRAPTNTRVVLAGVGNPLPHTQPLLYAQAEVEEVACHFTEVRMLSGLMATKSALRDAAVGATYIHLACHALFNHVTPLASRLDLAESETLTLGEILADEPFSTARLVVASACQTAVTDFTHVPDEAIGFPAAFLQTGTPGVVATLWPVDDLSTALMMERFYRYHLEGEPSTGETAMRPASALRRAQRWLAGVTEGELAAQLLTGSEPRVAREQAPGRRMAMQIAMECALRFGSNERKSSCPYAHPYYWAPFVFVGA